MTCKHVGASGRGAAKPLIRRVLKNGPDPLWIEFGCPVCMERFLQWFCVGEILVSYLVIGCIVCQREIVLTER